MRRAVVMVVVGVVVLLGSAGPASAGLQGNTFGATGEVSAGGHRARVTVLLGCDEGGSVRFTVTVRQGDTVATGHGAGVCTGEREAYPVTVTARDGRLVVGEATACGEALNRERRGGTDTRTWCRADPVVLVAA